MLKRILKSVRGSEPNHPLPGWPKSRGYDLHLPKTVSDKPLPLVIAIHGYTHDGAQMAALTAPDGQTSHPDSLNSLADEQGFAVVYPYGTRIGLLPGRCWNAGGGVNEYAPVGDPAQRNSIDDVSFFGDLLAHLGETENLDSKRVFLVGISNGGAMAQRLAVEAPELWTAVATVAGCNQFAAAAGLSPQSPMPLLHIHGTEDRVWPYQGGEMKPFGLMDSVPASVKRWVQTNSAEMTRQEEMAPLLPKDPTRIKMTHYRGQADVELYSVVGGGHAWPGGFQYLPKRVIGLVSQQLCTNRLLWDFFCRQCSVLQ